MRLQEVITIADALRPNAFENAQKIRWIQELDGRVKREILDARAGFEEVEEPVYTSETSTAVLLVPEPYSEIYVYWLFMKMDFINGETARFNNSALMHNTAWLNYAHYVARTCAPSRNTKLSGI